MTSYWLSNICSLTNSININPFSDGDRNFKFNSLTRLIILVTIGAAIFLKQNQNEILLGGTISIFLSVIIYMLTHSSGKMSRELNVKEKENKKENEGKTPDNSLEELSDHDINMANQITLDYSPPDTKLKEGSYFLKPNEMPTNVIKTKVDPKKLLSSGKQIPTGGVKQLQGLIGKNLSFN